MSGDDKLHVPSSNSKARRHSYSGERLGGDPESASFFDKHGVPNPFEIAQRLRAMEAIKKQVDVKLKKIGGTKGDVKTHLTSDEVDINKLKTSFAVYRGKYKGPLDLSCTALSLYLKEKDNEAYDELIETLDEEETHFLDIESQVDEMLKSAAQTTPPPPPNPNSSEYQTKFPQRELVKFSGDVRGWLAFNACFKTFHEDKNLKDIDKFHILLQSMEKDSEADKLVRSFPVSSENYNPAYNRLKERYGRDNVLVKVYVRDILKLVVDNASGKRINFTEVVTQLSSQVRNLASLGVTQDKCAQVLYPVVESCLPDDTMMAWQRSSEFKEDLDTLIDFLETEVNRQTERKLAKSQFGNTSTSTSTPTTSSSSKGKGSKSNGKGTPDKTASFAATSNTQKMCVFCEKEHSSMDCRKAQHMPHSKKTEILKSKKCCVQCLKPGHFQKDCKINSIKCPLCSKKHYLVMCPLLTEDATTKDDPQPSTSTGGDKANPGSSASTSSAGMKNSVRSTDVPLQTLIATAYGKDGVEKRVRIMFDSGSQKSYILSPLANDLKLEKIGEEQITHDLFGGQSKLLQHDLVRLFLGNKDGTNRKHFEVRSIGVIAPNIISPRSGPWIQEFAKKGAIFSDFGKGVGKIDVLIGNDVRPHCFTGRKITLHDGPGPVAEETIWDWVLSGKLPPRNYSSSTSSMMVTNLHVADRPISDLWSLETIGIRDSAEKETREEMDKQVIKHFQQTVQRHEDGRYQVTLPWLTGMKAKLPNNFYSCVRRLKSTTSKLKQSGYLENYHSIFQQWEDACMIEKVTDDHEPHLSKSQYLPHRAVIRLTSNTTPVRPVFDASAKLKGHASLNESVDKGANTLELIPSILTRFRLYQYGVTADIQKAFQQISVAQEDRDYLRFLWWSDISCQELTIYRHTRVVFGVSASPFLLGITLTHHIQQHTSNREERFSKLLIENMYVDNLVASLPSQELANQFKLKSQEMLLPAKFDLRGWELGPADDDRDIPVLGLIWNLKQDTLRLDVSAALAKIKEEKKITQRILLSLAHSLFDPLGFVSPFMVGAKLLLRQCHMEKLGWDTPLPSSIQVELQKWTDQIPHLENLAIPRYIFYGGGGRKSLHIFCDASSSAYAACAFLRVETEHEIKVSLVQSRSRVAPKAKPTTTIPRLELISCTVGVRLCKTIIEDIGDQGIQVTFWTDSSCALAWITGAGPWGVFVNNRKTEINNLSDPLSWKHIPGKFNPADLPSRGCSASYLVRSKWWEGPQWLRQPCSTWPTSAAEADPSLIEAELRKTVVSCASTSFDQPVLFQKLLKFSCYQKILRIISYWLRYLKWLKNKNHMFWALPISLEDINKAEIILLKHIQQKLHQQPHHMKRLRPFLDDQGIIRTRTRLIHEDEENFKTPIILPNKNKFVSLLIAYQHQHNNHIGTEMLLAHMRERFWIVQGRRTIRKVINSCWICRRFLARPLQVPEAPLPPARTGLGYPFEVTGVDAAGPLLLKKKDKVWIVLFTCATYRAIHLEIVDTLSTEGFLRALRHFIARRARPRIIYSDNALNFVGAQRVTSTLDWNKVNEYAVVNRIEWRFNPPTAPWWGGFWERMIGVVKGLLRRMLGKRVLHLPELVTLCLEVEEAVNNRPLTYVTEDPDDPQPLTPNHFIKNAATPSTFPEADQLDAQSFRAAYRKLQHLREALRSRFRKEYIGQLLNHKHNQKMLLLQPGDVVMIEHDNVKRQDWPLAVILSAIPGKDGRPRAYKLRTKTGEVIRPAQRLFPMELPQQESANLQQLAISSLSDESSA